MIIERITFLALPPNTFLRGLFAPSLLNGTSFRGISNVSAVKLFTSWHNCSPFLNLSVYKTPGKYPTHFPQAQCEVITCLVLSNHQSTIKNIHIFYYATLHSLEPEANNFFAPVLDMLTNKLEVQANSPLL